MNMLRSFTVIPMLCLIVLTGCGGEIEPGRTGGEPLVVSGLELSEVEVRTLPGAEAFVGTVESSDRGLVAARIDGRVGRIAVREGDRVKAGELLLTLEENQARDRLAAAEGGLREAAARLDLAEKTHARYLKLFEKEAVTPQEMDQVAAALEMARQSLRQAEAGAGAARTGASYSRVTAPYAATVVRREVEEGSTVMPGTPLLVLDRRGAMRVRVDLPESWTGRLSAGDELTVEIPSLERRLTGRVSEILPATDPRSRTFAAKLDLPPSEGVVAGLFARVFPGENASEGILIPASALVQRGQLSGVYVVREGILRYRLVKTGRRLGESVEILSGLSPGETVVTKGVERARSGARVGG